MILDWKGAIFSSILFIILLCYLMLIRPNDLYEKVICFLANCLLNRGEDRKREWLAILHEIRNSSEKEELLFLLSLVCATIALLLQSFQPRRLLSTISTNILHYCDRLYLGKSTPQNIQDDLEILEREKYK